MKKRNKFEREQNEKRVKAEEEALFKDPNSQSAQKASGNEDELTHLREMVKKL